jgi:uncharacterized protein (DUF2164 family)
MKKETFITKQKDIRLINLTTKKEYRKISKKIQDIVLGEFKIEPEQVEALNLCDFITATIIFRGK